MMTGSFPFEQSFALFLSGIQVCFHLLALFACLKHRYLSWAVPVIAVGLLGQLSTTGVNIALLISQQIGLRDLYSQSWITWLFSGLRLISVLSTVCVSLGLVLLLTDFVRQLQLWRESAGDSGRSEDDSLSSNS